MKLTGKMVSYFLVVVFVSSIGFGLIVYDSMHTQEDIKSVYEEEIPRLAMVNEIIANSLTETASIRGFIISRDESMIAAYKKASDENAKIEAELIKGVRTEERRKALMVIQDTDNKYSEVVEKRILPLIREGKADDARAAIAEAGQHADKLIKATIEYRKIITDVSNKALVDSIDSAGNTIKISIIAAIISGILGVIIAVFSARSIASKVGQLAALAKKVADGDLTESYRGSIDRDEIGDLATALNSMVISLKQLVTMINGQAQNIAASSEELTASADQSAQASTQVAGSITEVANGTGKQLESVKAANGVVENMVAELEEVSANVGMVADKAGKTAEMATTGGKSANRAIAQMNEVEKTVSESAKVVAQLGERSQEIGQIVDTISSIAGQTNLLALNAAIEAARAGEQGRGFAVVAEEVRKLAEQSQEAAKRIAGLIGEIQVETTRAVAAMDNGTREVKIGAEVVNETGVSFQEIIGLVNQVSDQVNSIAKVVQSVAEGSEHIVSSVQDISDLSNSAAGEIQTVSAATEEQSASMQQIAAASQNLSRLAQTMQETVERFRV